MEPELIALGFLAALVLSVPVLVVVLIVRWSAHRQLRSRVERLEREVQRLSAASPAGAPAPRAASDAASRAQELARAIAAPTLDAGDTPEVEAQLASEVVAAPPSPTGTIDSAAPVAPTRTEAETPAAPRVAIDWERWFGVQGAALLGGAFLALAGLLFVQYSIERGWLNPAVRCVLGALVGVCAMLASGPLRRRSYRAASDAMCGAGVALLFASSWAAYALYELLPFFAAFGALAATTVACGALALRRSSRTIAWFGLIGGFSTPLLLSFDASRPLGLFLYLLGLDAAVLAICARQQWRGFAAAAAVATHLLFGLWIATAFQPSESVSPLLLCGALGLMFAALGARDERLRIESCLGAALPFLTALFFARDADFSEHIAPIAALLAVLGVAAAWIALRGREPRMLLVAGVGSAAGAATWIATAPPAGEWMWECAVATALLAAIPHVAAELGRVSVTLVRRAAESSIPLALCVLYGAAHADSAQLAPWLVAALAIALLHLRAAHLGAGGMSRLAAAVSPAAAYALWRAPGGGDLASWTSSWVDGVVNAALAGFAVVAAVRTREPQQRVAAANSAVAAVVLLLFASARNTASDATVVVVSASALLAIGLFAARDGWPRTSFAAIACGAFVTQSLWTIGRAALDPPSLLVFAALLAAVSILAITPARSARIGATAWTHRLSALATLLWVGPVAVALERWRPDASESTPPILLAAVGGLVALRSWPARAEFDSSARRSPRSSGFAWSGAVAVLLLAIAFALRIERAEALLVFAACAGGLAWLAHAARHDGLLAWSFAASALTLAGVFGRIATVVAHPTSHAVSGYPIAHELSLDFGFPAAMLFAASAASRLAARRRESARTTWPSLATGATGLAAIVALFVWLNVEVIHACSVEHYAFELRRMPTRDIALSATWTLYSLALLIAGVRFDRSTLRWTSLGFFLATIGKVFLYDLGELRGLQRVVSLLGLAMALICVSLLYQRFVFRRRTPAESPISA